MSGVKRNFMWPLVAALAIAGGSYFGAVELGQTRAAWAASPEQTAKPTQQPQSDTVAPATDLSRAFRAVHASLENAVVNINVTKKSVASRGPVEIPEQLRNMLPPGFDPDQLQNQMQNQQVEGTGSGVIVSADGYILTNNHVVNGADDVTVALADGRELKAEVVGTDPKTDLAVIRIKADHLTFAKFGDSDALDVGDWVLAFGSPFGISQTMTQGIISAKGRSHMDIIASHDPTLRQLTYENYLQTDAAINPGNSGGPLVNLKGEVVGINSAIASNTGAYNGIGFSIPSNDAKYIMDSLIEHGKVIRGYLGIRIEDMNHPVPDDQDLVDSIHKAGFKSEHGVLVSDVPSGGPAAKAGLERGDVITAINGKTFDGVDDLRRQIARLTPDSKLTLAIFHDGKAKDLTATVGTQPDSLASVANSGERNTNERGNRDHATADNGELGVRVQDLTPGIARQYDLKGKQGAVVTQVEPNSLAADVGLHAGDVITRVNKTDISSAKELKSVLDSAKLSDGLRLQVRSDDGTDRMVFVEKK